MSHASPDTRTTGRLGIRMQREGQKSGPSNEARLQRWIEHFGITQTQLEAAVHAAGAGPDDVERHLLDSGASAGAG